MSQVAALTITCKNCGRCATAYSTNCVEVLKAELKRYGWVIGRVTLCPKCKEKGN